MFGLVVVVVGLIYLAVLIAVTRFAYSAAKKRGYSKAKCRLAAAGGFLIVYLPLFWDHIPTVVTHQYYCVTEAGFWEYKTVDQWKGENPGVMEGLPAPRSTGSPTKYDQFDDGYGETFTYLLNERFNWIIAQHDISSMLPIIRTEQQVKDIEKNEVLARYIDYSTGNSVKTPIGPPGPLKFWLRSQHCIGGANNQDNLRGFRDHFYGSKK